MAPPVQSILDQRRDQIFPKLDPLDIERVRRFGDVRSYAAGERLMTAGQVSPGLVVILAGTVAVAAHDHLGIGQQIFTPAQGNFMGELAEWQAVRRWWTPPRRKPRRHSSCRRSACGH